MKTCIDYRKEIQELIDEIDIDCLKQLQKIYNCKFCKDDKPECCRFYIEPYDPILNLPTESYENRKIRFKFPKKYINHEIKKNRFNIV